MNDPFYARYHALRVRRHEHGIVEIVMSGEGANKSGLATADARMHRELADIWRDIDRDPDTRVAVIRGEGKGFSAGGDLQLPRGVDGVGVGVVVGAELRVEDQHAAIRVREPCAKLRG